VKRCNCAIYTRKSSDEGLQQEFNSLDAQREACEAYILSQKHAGWTAVPDMYDDGGLSGGTMERPALQRLLTDIKAGKVQIVVVYKVDRLTRSLADFAKIVDVLDAHYASFVSVTQSFNTTTSMGRLTLNMLLSFAQFEREIAGERIRDKIAASKAKGMWMGGFVPLGYDVKDRKLVVNEAEAAVVRQVFQRYAELGSVQLLRRELDRRGTTSKRRESRNPRLTGGRAFSRGALYTLLQNRIYRGEIVHDDKVYSGQHEPIVDLELWQMVQDRLALNRCNRSLAVDAAAPSLLAGLVVEVEGQRMTPTHANKRGRRYRYYVSASLIEGKRAEHAKGRRIPAGDIEGLVLDRLRSLFASQMELGQALAPLNLDAATLSTVLTRSISLVRRWTTIPSTETRGILMAIVEQVVVGDDQIAIRLKRPGILSSLLNNGPLQAPPPDVAPHILTIAARLRRAGRGTRLVIGDNVANKIDAGLSSLIRDAYTTRQMLLSAPDHPVAAFASRSGNKRDNVTTLIRLSYLSPEIVRAVLEGRHPVELTANRLIQVAKGLPHDWEMQRQYLGFPEA